MDIKENTNEKLLVSSKEKKKNEDSESEDWVNY
jgi:hypothetical protein